ncbi:ABC transporter permease subunit [Hwanghaeella grinnelliae]|uniref:ABC transporter permease subunit n=1 Tax=Hwanghaeella grinnelliae TaxID=2500179 RepID=A0A3S2Z5W5_9PROT|nr:ABC transporter permease subunit [Hwanghaeella grinnelliae]RVU33809.1 ABC transporter permease subunit [Hwanghaeella grinnelliae]
MAVEAERAGGGVSWWYDKRTRAIIMQVVVISLFVAFIGYIVNNTATNMEARGLSPGFGFMDQIAGFNPTSAEFNLTDFDVNSSTHGDVFILGLVNTLVISAIGVVLATIVGFTMGVLRLSKNPLINFLASCYVEVMRNIPLLLHIFIWYFAVWLTLPELFETIDGKRQLGAFNLFGLDMVFISQRGINYPNAILNPGWQAIPIALALAIAGIVVLAKWAKKRQDATGQPFPVLWTSIAMLIVFPVIAYLIMGGPIGWDLPEPGRFNLRGGATLPGSLMGLLLALVVYTGAFIAEAVRSGIQSVSHGQTEAAFALGLRPNITTRKVIIPQAMRVIVPPMTSQYLNLTKNSSLAVAIGYPDLVNIFTGVSLNQTGNAVEIIAMTMGVYLTISLVISLFMNWYNKSVTLVER